MDQFKQHKSAKQRFYVLELSGINHNKIYQKIISTIRSKKHKNYKKKEKLNVYRILYIMKSSSMMRG